MRFRNSLRLTLALCFVVCGSLLPANVYAKSARTTKAAQSRQTVTGTVVSISGRQAGRTRQFTLRVNSYTSASDAERLNAGPTTASATWRFFSTVAAAARALSFRPRR